MDPAFRLMHFPLDSELGFYLKNNLLIKKMTWSRHLFLFYFKRVNKIRKKTLSTTPYFEKGDLRKIGLGSRVRLLIGKVR